MSESFETRQLNENEGSSLTKIRHISIENFHKLLLEHPKIIDVRFPDEYEAGHIPGALNVPYPTIDHFEPKEKTYIICQGGVNSLHSTRKLAVRGYDVVNVEGGMSQWIYPVNTGKKA